MWGDLSYKSVTVRVATHRQWRSAPVSCSVIAVAEIIVININIVIKWTPVHLTWTRPWTDIMEQKQAEEKKVTVVLRRTSAQ